MRVKTKLLAWQGGLLMATIVASSAGEPGYKEHIRDGVIRNGDHNYDDKTHLVLRNDDMYQGLANIAQHSPEYVAALLDSGKRIDRANAIIGGMLDHQWLKDKGTRWYGNFIWWHHLKKPADQNAVSFMTPWLCFYLLEHQDKLTEEIRIRLHKALPLCLKAVRKHTGAVHYDNIWFLNTASLVMIGLVIEQPGLFKEAESRIDQWISYVSRNGINEFNSPTYGAVNVYALEFIWRFLPVSEKTFRDKVEQLLDFCYADIFMNWHWEADIGAGTHSRAYSRDRLTGKSLVSFLIRRQCGGKLRADIRPFEYSFVVSDYVVPESIRAYARKKGKTPLTLRASHPGWTKDIRVDRSLYMISEVTLGTQTGYRANADQAIPFKITYIGSKVDERASFITPVPPHIPGLPLRSSIMFAHHQEGPSAIVLYEADIKGRKENAYLRLVIDPTENQDMVEAILVNGKPYDKSRIKLKPGAVIAWQVGKAMVAIRLLDAWGVDSTEPSKHLQKDYAISPTKGAGLCLHGLVCYQPRKKVAVNNMSCGFVVQVGSTKEFGSLTRLSQQAAAWTVNEKREKAARDIQWNNGKQTLRLHWRGEANKVLARETNGAKIGPFPLYESPLINLGRGGKVQAAAELGLTTNRRDIP